MRTILFKAKRKDNCEWVEGYYLPGMKFPAYDGVNDFIIEKNGDYYTICTDTLCQYTGLIDKNGKRIWENDIVVDEDDCYSEVFWNKKLYNYSLRCLKTEHMFLMGKRWDVYLLANNNQLKVVGNIFDNAGLSEVK